MADIVSELKKYVKEEKIIVGTDTTLKGLKNGEVEKVFIAENTSEQIKDDVNHYADIAGAQVVVVPMSNEDLGNVCKKTFSITVLGLKK